MVVEDVEAKLSGDQDHHYKAVMLVHNGTATGTTSKISEVRKALNRVGHPALLMVDAVSSLGSIDYRHDEWQVDVMVASSQKGLMLPPGLAFNAISEKALAAGKTAKLPRSYWDWKEILPLSRNGFFPVHPVDQLDIRLTRSVEYVAGGGPAKCILQTSAPRSRRLAQQYPRGAWNWFCEEPTEYSNTVTAVFMPTRSQCGRLASRHPVEI